MLMMRWVCASVDTEKQTSFVCEMEQIQMQIELQNYVYNSQTPII